MVGTALYGGWSLALCGVNELWSGLKYSGLQFFRDIRRRREAKALWIVQFCEDLAKLGSFQCTSDLQYFRSPGSRLGGRDLGSLDCERCCIIVDYFYIDVTSVMQWLQWTFGRDRMPFLQLCDVGVHCVCEGLSNRLLVIDCCATRWSGSFTGPTTSLSECTC